MNSGWEQRLHILKRDAEEKFLRPLHIHGWKAKIEQEVRQGEYLIISAERGGHSRLMALMYSSATENKIYKKLAEEVEHIFINSQLYHLESFAMELISR